jgi:hypothetical protein
MGTGGHGRFQFSTRSLLLLTAVLAFLLVPVAWVTRERQQMRRLQDEMLVAREVALRSFVLEAKRRQGVTLKPESGTAEAKAVPKQLRDDASQDRSTTIEQLRRENSALRQQNKALREEVQALKNTHDQHAPQGGLRTSGRPGETSR